MMNACGTYSFINLGMSVRIPTFKSGAAVYKTDYLGDKTPAFMSPEIEEHVENIDPFASDIWAMGMIMYILLTGLPVYTKVGDVSFKMVSEGRVETMLDHTLSHDARDLITSMLRIDPIKRLTIQEAIHHTPG